jgi:hypothetical protein
MWEACALIVLVLACLYWYDSLRARERALLAGRAACEHERVQFLDETVALSSLRVGRDEAGRLRLRRFYAFEFSDPLLEGGNNRRDGSVVMLADRVESLTLAPVRIQ